MRGAGLASMIFCVGMSVMQKDSAKVLIDVMMAQFFDANLLCGQLEVVVHGLEGSSGLNGPNGRSTDLTDAQRLLTTLFDSR